MSSLFLAVLNGAAILVGQPGYRDGPDGKYLDK